MKRLEKLKSNILRISIGIVYLIFGFIKFIPHLSPAEDLAKNTIGILTLGILPSQWSLLLLAVGETLIGIFLLLNWKPRIIISIAIIHILFTFTPLFLMPEEIFGKGELVFTLAGQYIFKNIIILSALFSLKIDLDIHLKHSAMKESTAEHLIVVKN
ncbi:MAG: DoxX family membrane protein [Maribacter sp.]